MFTVLLHLRFSSPLDGLIDEEEIEFRDYFYRDHHAHSWSPEASKRPSEAPQQSSGTYDHVIMCYRVSFQFNFGHLIVYVI